MNIDVFFSSLCLSWPLNAVPPMCAHCSLDSLAGSNPGTHLSCLLCCTHSLSVPVCVLFPVQQTIVDNKLLCQQREPRFLFFYMLLKAVVRAQTPLHIQKGSLTCHFGAPHAGLVSLVTGLWFLHSGWPPWAAGLPTDRCWLTNQQLSTTNLCCRPSRLTAFCVTVIELNRW